MTDFLTPFPPVKFCPVCAKEFTLETAYKRHVAYCRRAQSKRKGRPVSCRACSSAKTKCSFAKPRCARCESKGLDCLYDEAGRRIAPGPQQQRQPPNEAAAAAAPNMTTSTTSPSSTIYGLGGLLRFDPEHPLPIDATAIAEPNEFDYAAAALNDTLHPSELGIRLPYRQFEYPKWTDIYLTKSPPFDVALSSDAPSTISSDSPNSMVPTKEKEWVDYEQSVEFQGAMMPLRYQLREKTSATELAFSMFAAFPQMMTRTKTLPPFMHIPTFSYAMPERIATCQSIAQLFAARTAETSPFLWRTIDAEVSRISEEIGNLSKYQVQHAIQALMIYMVMLKTDGVDLDIPRGLRFVATYWDLTVRMLKLLKGGKQDYFATEQTRPSVTWEDWIFNETRRRLIAFWFVMRQVMALKFKCGLHEYFDVLPLVAPKALWEARTREEWETEKAFYDLSDPFMTYGDLARAKIAPEVPLNARRLVDWDAGTDKLGTLINMSITML